MNTLAANREIESLMSLHPKGFDLSLDRISRLLERLGNPQDHLPPVIHIAGTNGKGSCAAFSRALLEAAGHRVHVHTSPHLVNWHERYRLAADGGGRLVEDEVFAEAIARVAKANEGQKITVFEILTAVTFLLFSEHPADAVIIEVGLGGRFDATNVIKEPAVSVIMPVSLDHESFLGDRVELIAAEKAGIIKSGCPVVIAAQESETALQVLVDTAERLDCPAFVYGQDFLAFEENGRMVYQDEDGLMDLSPPRLPGRHQFANAAAAIAAVKAAGFEISHRVADKAMANVTWPGRMQKLPQGRLTELAPKGADIWLDGGHNPGAGVVVAEALAEQEEKNPRPLFLICGMINTKDQSGYFRAFKGLARHVYTVPVSLSEASVPNDELAVRAVEAGLSAEPVSSVANALMLLRDTWDGPPPRILISGSLYLAGAVLAENGTPPV
ncbi:MULTISPECIES: folylpolyglutamate synthase/dihydrofolate synthase family protein [unclassified Mesorhizobium]|uniref:bifunctional folylpolyglutamate synthase/dihydrofolate synthase n=1 Tax=unclassified Mesorhizobium TaxID=325217 RepID=UPI000FE97D00|nr:MULTISPECIES: folylpolyglutamate synthase/dihydrofolate synthase family protein [unclassified Mesorhizobium]RWI28922.1 MAG: bifunctional folylpolyglutamate synthase/dihydrofolate synthase [Mesorhizobium sp.]RWK52958.1 MAG: bifunctional folylpolyglutamate synthase/dihydrofolate synthase [Mesorhizobium sp.]RWK97865.1 MAG: bifunctional folylpolyglutamate synthase/dihydrofolate synthase [Mesorhizobium sp.]TIQ31130.1 MAG: bifunctional folylpolyglutamate synthase/dihydrofolate synthase [Mesorhizob